MDCFTLTKFEVRPASDNQLLVLVVGSQVYKSILSRALPQHFMSRAFEDRLGRYDWGTYIHDVDNDVRLEVETLLHLFQGYIYIEDDLTETFALDYHTEIAATGLYQKTAIGALVYQAKPYHRAVRPSNYTKASELAKHFLTFIRAHPSYSCSDLVISVPPSDPAKAFNLPAELVKKIAAELGIADGSGLVKRIRVTKPMKDCSTPQEKINNVRNAFAVTNGDELEGKNVLLIDDVYASGFTINEVGRVLLEAGAHAVFGLVATKTSRDV
jgi:predicted amidophosphoribosyltransferase